VRILIVGGTGTVGSEVMRSFLKRGDQVRIMTRTPAKARHLPPGATAVGADLESPSSLVHAFEGAEAVFIATPLHPDEAQLGLNAVRAAVHARVGHAVYMSVYKVDTATHISHFAAKLPIEERLRISGVPYTILRPNNFFQNDYRFKDAITRYGVYPQPVSAKGISRVDVRDIADAAVAAITQAGSAGRTWPVVGPHSLTGQQVADTYAARLHRDIHYIGDDLDGWEQNARQAMPEWRVRDLRIMYEHFREHGFAAAPEDVAEISRVLGRPPRSFDTFVSEVAVAWTTPVA